MLLCLIQKIPVPLAGDKAAVKKYAADMEALKRKVCEKFFLPVLLVALHGLVQSADVILKATEVQGG